MLNKIKPFNPLSDYNKAIKTLQKNNVRPTKQRMILAKLLFEKGRRHISAEELYDEVKKHFISYSDLMALSNNFASDFWMNPDIDLEVMAKALKGFNEEIINKIVEYLPAKKQAMYTHIKEPLPKREVDSARGILLAIFRKKITSGEWNIEDILGGSVEMIE